MSTLHARMIQLIGQRHELHIDRPWQVCLPMVRGAGEEDGTEEDVRHDQRGGKRSDGAAPAGGRIRGFAGRQRELESILRRAHSDASHAGVAFD